LFRTIGHPAGDWLCLACLPPMAGGIVKASGLSNSPAVSHPAELALFCRGLSDVRFTITPFAQSTCPSCCSDGNWLCFARLPPRERRSPDRHNDKNWFVCTRPSAPSPQASSRLRLPGIGFVWHPCPIHHNSFPIKHLGRPASDGIGFVAHNELPRRTLSQIPQGAQVWLCLAQSARRGRGRRVEGWGMVARPHRPNWLCFAPIIIHKS
jgi:hypothetical protein